MASSKHIVLGAAGLTVAVILFVAGAQKLGGEDAPREDPTRPANPAEATQALTVEPNPVDYEATRIDPSLGDDTGEGLEEEELPDEYVEREPRPDPDTETPSPSDRDIDLDPAARTVELGAPPTRTPDVDIRRVPAEARLPDAAFRAAIADWTGPERCAKRARDGENGTVRVAVRFDASGAATALEAIEATPGPEARYVACLSEHLTGLEVGRLDDDVRREATLVF